MSKPRIAVATLLALLLVIGAGLLILTSRLDALVAGLIEKHGSAAAGTAVRVGGVSIELQQASARISALSVANPEGFDGAPAIELGNFSIRIDPGSITSDTIVLEEVTVNGARLRVLQQGGANNLRELLANLRRNSSASGEPADGGQAKKIVIERFALEDARASVSLPDLGEDREVTIPTVVVTDVGRASNGVTAAQAARQLLEPVLRKALESTAAQGVREKAGEKLDDSKQQLLDGVLNRLGDDDSEEQ